jgi:hypothetical protein
MTSAVHQQCLCDFRARAHRRSAELAGNPSAKHAAMVQRRRPSGTIEASRVGANTCCSMAVSKECCVQLQPKLDLLQLQ